MSGEDYMAALRSKILAEVGTTSSGKPVEESQDGGQRGNTPNNKTLNGKQRSSLPAGPKATEADTKSRKPAVNDSRRGPSNPRFQPESGVENRRRQDSRRGSPQVNTTPYRNDPNSRPNRFSGHETSFNGGSSDSQGRFQQRHFNNEKKSRFDNGKRDPHRSDYNTNTRQHMPSEGGQGSFRNSRVRDDGKSSGSRFHGTASRGNGRNFDRNNSNRSHYNTGNYEAVTAKVAGITEESIYNNLSDLRMNKTLIVTPMTPGFADHNSVIDAIKELVSSIGFESESGLKNDVVGSGVEKNRLLIEFSKESLTTIVLTCQKHLESKIQNQFLWQRPNSCIGNSGSQSPLLSEKLVSLMKLGPECDDEESTKQWLIDEEVEYTWLQTLRLKDKTWIRAVLYLPKSDSHKRLPASIKPNHGSMVQDFGQINYKNLPELVKRHERKPSKVICVLNSVDPMDLKNERFVEEIKEAMMYSTPIKKCGEVESVQVPLPNPDYRNDMNHIHSSIGKVFIKFKELAGAERAMITLPGSQFCSRTILCSYYSETDYDMGIL